jgi:nucleotide-binding universal stress UspA family protein
MKTLLCATDFTPCSENAVEFADELAQLLLADILLFHSIYAPAPSGLALHGNHEPEGFAQEEQEIRESKLKAIIQYLRYRKTANPINYNTLVSSGLTKDNIPAKAKEKEADLIVLGSEGVTRLKDLFVGSVAGGVILNTPCPVLIIPQQAKFRPLRKIVFATDLRQPFPAHCGLIVRIANLFHAEILFLHILTEESAEAHEIAQEEMIKICGSISYKNCSYYTETNPYVEEGISQFARRHKADMIVIGYDSHSFGEHLFPEDYEQEMAYHAFLPLLIIPSSTETN